MMRILPDEAEIVKEGLGVDIILCPMKGTLPHRQEL
jgi:hypothetical protein